MRGNQTTYLNVLRVQRVVVRQDHQRRDQITAELQRERRAQHDVDSAPSQRYLACLQLWGNVLYNVRLCYTVLDCVRFANKNCAISILRRGMNEPGIEPLSSA